MAAKHKAWARIFDRYKLLNSIRKDGYVDIDSKQIKAVDKEEPRLLAKIDFREQLPNIMRDNKLSVLAIKNGVYRIAPTDPFIDIAAMDENKVIEAPMPSNIICIDPFNVKTESAALDISIASGVLDKLFGKDCNLVIRGKIRADLSFALGGIDYQVTGVQVEVDGGYESRDKVSLVEAKRGYRSNINIRQLLYPYLYWQSELGGKKELQSFIFYLEGDVFRYIPYVYDGLKSYADHSQEFAFRFARTKTRFELYAITESPQVINMSAPFPQADHFERVDSILTLLNEEDGDGEDGKFALSKGEMVSLFNIHSRQIDYYTNVLVWLNLAKSDDTDGISLTAKGRTIAAMPFMQRMEYLAQLIFSDPIFNRRLKGRQIDNKFFADYRIRSGSTRTRRLQTVDAWIAYFTKIFSRT